MREVKFRALDENAEWVYGMPLTNVEYEEKEFLIMRNCDETGYWGIKNIDPKTLGQFTGLKDATGVEIYEGDICEELYEEILGVVKFSEGKFIIVWDNSGDDLFEVSDEVRVVGNIYEHWYFVRGVS